MEETAANQIYEYSPTLFWVIFTAAGAFFVAWWLRGFVSNISNIKDLGTKVDSIHSDVTTIKEYLVGKDQKLLSIFSMKRSPRVLNPNGELIYEIIHGEQFLSENKELLYKKITEKKPNTMLDVEMTAREACIELQSNPIFNKIKDIVYNHPEITIKDANNQDVKHAITMTDVYFVLSIPLRDMYLADHSGINQQTDNPEQN